jgi:hypothetical protein
VHVCYEGGDFFLEAVKEVFERGSRLVVVHVIVVVIGALIGSIVGRACLVGFRVRGMDGRRLRRRSRR